MAENGNLLLTWQVRGDQWLVTLYDGKGELKYEIMLSTYMFDSSFKVLPRCNGNFVLVSCNDYRQTKLLAEIDKNCSFVRQY